MRNANSVGKNKVPAKSDHWKLKNNFFSQKNNYIGLH